MKPVPQDTDPHAPAYFAPYDDMGNVRTINNAVDCGWSAIEDKTELQKKIEEQHRFLKGIGRENRVR